MIMGSFKAKIGWKRLRERENKNYRSFKFLPDRLQKIPKKQQKKKKFHYGSQNRMEMAENERK